jgi:exopolysaccharide production protein ExoQ
VNNFLNQAEKAFVILGLSFFTGGIGVGGEGTSTSGLLPTFALTAIRYFIWVTSGLLLCVRWRNTLIAASRDLFIWVLTAIVLASFLWSDYSAQTLFDSREIWQMTLFGLYMASRFSLKEQVKLVAWTLAIGAGLSLLFGIALPGIGKHGADHPGAWKGIYDYKNTLGSLMIIASLSFLLLPIEQWGDRWLKWGGLILAVALIFLSTSRTSLVISLLLLGMIGFYRKFRWQGRRTIVLLNLAGLALGCGVTFLVSNWVELIVGLGRDPTLSGRTPMWTMTFQLWQERPWLGFGRGAFWADGSKYAFKVGQAIANNFIPPHGHNGFVDLALDVGIIGLALFLLSFTIAYIRALYRAYESYHLADLFPLAYLTFLAMNNMTESYLIRITNLYWVLFIAVILSVKQGSQGWDREQT